MKSNIAKARSSVEVRRILPKDVINSDKVFGRYEYTRTSIQNIIYPTYNFAPSSKASAAVLFHQVSVRNYYDAGSAEAALVDLVLLLKRSAHGSRCAPDSNTNRV